jgi:hypothetical protein
MGQVATVTPSLNWRVIDGSDVVLALNKAAYTPAVSVTEAMSGTRVIAHSTTVALDFGSIASASVAMVWVSADSDVSTMRVEVNDSDDNYFTCTAWGASGGAGITGIEISNASGADALTIEYMIFE